MADDAPTPEEATIAGLQMAQRTTRRAVLGARYEADLLRRILAMLKALEADLIAQVAQMDLGGAARDSIRRKRLLDLLQLTRERIDRTYRGVVVLTTRELSELMGIEATATAASLRTSFATVGITLGVALPTASTMAALTDEMLVLGAPMKNWWKRQSQSLIDEFAKQMRLSIMAGESVDRMALRITGGYREGVKIPGVMDVSRRTAETLVRTSVASVQNTARLAVFEQNLDVIDEFVHLSRLDSRTSEICIARSNKRWNADTKKPIGHAFPFQVPPLHPRCRSVLVPVVIGGKPPPDQTPDEWLASLSPDEQDSLLGKGKASLYRQGRITSKDLIDQTNRPLTLRELRARSNEG